MRAPGLAPDWLPFTLRLNRRRTVLRLALALFLNGLCAVTMFDFAGQGPAWLACVLAALFLALSWVPLLTVLPQDPRAVRLRILWDRATVLVIVLFAALVAYVAVAQLRWPTALIDAVMACLPVCVWLILDNYPGAWPHVPAFLFSRIGPRGPESAGWK
jgi:hypothetical protein